MLCRACRRQRPRDDRPCPSCGASRAGAPPELELVVGATTRVALVEKITIGRATDCDIRLDDPSVSRHHAEAAVTPAGSFLRDAGSSHGTYLNDVQVSGEAQPLRDGDRVRVGDTRIVVERPRDEHHAGRTIVVPPGASLLVPAVGAERMASDAGEFGFRPRVRSGWAMKRLDAAEGDRRYMLADLRGQDYLRMGEPEAELFQLMDGSCTLPELIAEAEQRLGPTGPARLARLLADLGDRGMLEGVEGRGEMELGGGLRSLFQPRELTFGGAGRFFDWVYRHGGFLLFTRPVLLLQALIAIGGLAGFIWLVATGSANPLIVNHSLGLGSLCFLIGRFAVVAFHECAHGLTMSSFGRRVRRAGLKLLLIFPYAFVDTSEAWFEPRRRRIAVSLAGPVSDFVVGGACALVGVAAGGSVREVAFQIVIGAYLGAVLNLNPFMDRDGYHVLVDMVGQPGLRKRARERLALRLAGEPVEQTDTRVLEVYALAGIGWLLVAAAFGILMSVRYYAVLVDVAPKRWIALVIIGAFDLLLLMPVVVTVGRPLLRRVTRRKGGAGGG